MSLSGRERDRDLKIRSNYHDEGPPLICLTPPYFVPVPSQDLDFHRQISWSFYVQRYEVRGSCTFC